MALVKMGIGESRISAEGYGSAYPLVPNDSEANRAKNRRIDLRVVEK
jgi:outer membrane protein OmpA-like peptidoglycan-associated protein